jgi:DNA polymerase III subunit chi
MKKVCFFRVSNASAKLSCICQTVQKHFEKKEALLLILPTQEAAVYIDQLLWRQPEDSFLPHAIANTPTIELIAITILAANVNKAKILFNLQPSVTDFVDQFDMIYDLMDLTHPTKAEQSHARIVKYKSMNFLTELSDLIN